MKLIDIPEIDRNGIYEINTDKDVTVCFYVYYDVTSNTYTPDYDSPPQTDIIDYYIDASILSALNEDGDFGLTLEQRIDLELQLENYIKDMLI